MSTTWTTNVGIGIPALGDKNYHLPVNDALARLDLMGGVGPFAVRPSTPGGTTLLPSGSLNVNVAAGSYRKISDNTIATYAGTTGHAIPASSTRKLWLDASGTLQAGTAWPTGISYVRLATVTTDGGHVTAIVDERVYLTQIAS